MAAVWTLGPTVGTANNVAQASAEGLSGSPITFIASGKSAPPSGFRWQPRNGHTASVFDNKLWVMGGLVAGRVNDVWFSSDGADWTEATSSAAWAGRQGHTSLVFDAKMWVIGGRDNNEARLNDVWYSTDGVSWTEATSSAAWPPRSGHTSVVFDNRMWVIGGRRTTGFGPGDFLNDVWHSTDGVTWTEATSAAPWTQRHDHTSEVFDGKIWVIGGVLGLAADPSSQIFSDVWRSTDGVSWIRATASASWGPRASHSSLVFGSKIWVIGGRNRSERFNDVWSSSNGSNWTVATSTAPWEARQGHTSVVFDLKMWVLGGLLSNVPLPQPTNDIWHSGDGGNWTNATAGAP